MARRGAVALVSSGIRSGDKRTKIKLAAKAFTAAPGKNVKVVFQAHEEAAQAVGQGAQGQDDRDGDRARRLGNASSRQVNFQLTAARERK